MIKLSFEYTIVNTDIIKVEPKIIKDETTNEIELCIAGSTKEYVMDQIEKSNLIKEPGVNEILNNIGKNI
jgi:hypothetical protein